MAKFRTPGEIHYDIMRRCYNPECVSYNSYGGKGIQVCEEWHDREVFKAWAYDNGYSKELKLCRKDFSKGYTPDNCYFGEGYKTNYGKKHAAIEAAKKNKQMKAEIGLKRITDSPLLKIYYSMHTRCENPNHRYYDIYGGRGIKVCDEWSGKNGSYNFIKWANNTNWHPGLTLDRINNDKGYSPDNCKWATQKEQIRNRRNTLLFDYHGLSLTISEIAQLENIKESKLRYRLSEKRMSLSDAIKECKQ